jgi:effector-binding domain-containing protein/uncharacterized protein YndB with AHSA1/START domain
VNFLKKLLLGLIALVVLLIGIAFVLPNSASVSRSIVIERPASMIFPLLDGYGRFNEWSPWFALDPKTEYAYSGPARGLGANSSWKSDDPKVGSGSQTITAVVPNQRIETQLDFGDMGRPVATFELTPTGGGTTVQWGFVSSMPITFDGNFLNGVIGRYFGLFLDKLVGPDYARGLANLKKLSESMPNIDIAGLKAEQHEVPAQPAYFVSTEAGLDAASSSTVMTQAYGEIMAFLSANGLKQVAPPYALIQAHEKDKWVFDAGIPVDRNDVAVSGNVKSGAAPSGKVVDFTHIGSYDTLAETHNKAHAWLAVYGLKETGQRAEIYVSDPMSTPAAEVITLVRVTVE